VTDQRDVDSFTTTLRRALEDEQFRFAPLLEQARRQMPLRRAHEIEFPSRIAIDNQAHSTYTLIQIEAPDRIGLLYDILSCLDREGLSIALSRISTQAGAAIDTFYVADRATHSKVTDSNRIATLQKHLQSAVIRSAD
jgi:[protein-PII] uridylyltransferase